MATKALVILAFVCVAATAQANPRRKADEHTRRGIALYNLGKYEASIDEFEQAYTLYQSDALLFNLAQAHRQLQHCERALHYYRRFLEGAPSPPLVAQVEQLLPKLEAACRTKLEPPAGPVAVATTGDARRGRSIAVPRTNSSVGQPLPAGVSSTLGATDAGPSIAAVASRAATDSTDADDEPQSVAFATPPAAPASIVSVTGMLVGGVVLAGRSAPSTGARLAITVAPSWLGGIDLGGTVGMGRLWRGDDRRNATIAQVAGTLRYHAEFPWGRITLAGELGASYMSSLDDSNGVIPGITNAAYWALLVRGEAGVERNIQHGFSVRLAVAAAASPRTGPMLSPIAQLDLLVGFRYQP